MFDIGFWELCLIGVVALVVLGPEKLPRAARTAGLWMGKARRAIADVQAEVQRELDLEDLRHIGQPPPSYPELMGKSEAASEPEVTPIQKASQPKKSRRTRGRRPDGKNASPQK